MVGLRNGKVKRTEPSRRIRWGILSHILCAHLALIKAVLGNSLSDEGRGRDRNKKMKKIGSRENASICNGAWFSIVALQIPVLENVRFPCFLCYIS